MIKLETAQNRTDSRQKVASSNRQIKWARHPLAFLVEAADDISYLTSDVDDAHRMKNMTEAKANELLNMIIELRDDIEFDVVSITDNRQKISYLRTVAATTLLKSAADEFVVQYDSIMRGKFNSELLLGARTEEKITHVKNEFRNEVFRTPHKLEMEAVGYNVITGLMELFGGMISEFICNDGKLSKRNENLYHLLPKESVQRMKGRDPYRCMLVLTDYVSGMTDRYALDLYQKLYGNSASLGKMT